MLTAGLLFLTLGLCFTAAANRRRADLDPLDATAGICLVVGLVFFIAAAVEGQ